MRYLCAIFCLVITVKYCYAEPTPRGKYFYPLANLGLSANSVEESSLRKFKSLTKSRQIKYQIISGNTDYARNLLSNTGTDSSLTKAINYRYLALIQFIEGDYLSVLKTLNKPIMKEFKFESSICFMKVLSYLITDQLIKGSDSWKTCKQATGKYSSNNLDWMQIIVDLKTKKDTKYIDNIFKNINIELVSEENLGIYLKLALYLNKHEKIIPRFKYFGTAALENINYRELIGLNYYRNGDLVKANQLLGKLNTTNAEVFKGNIYLFQKKYENAYAQYKLALKLKNNSKNALERLLPLSWKLNLWEDGLQYLQRMEVTHQNLIETYTLMAAFLTLSDKHKSAKEYLLKIKNKTISSEPIEVTQINVLNSIKLKDTSLLEHASEKSCQGFDGLNCWLTVGIKSWKGLTDLLEEKSLIHTNTLSLAEKYTKQTNFKSFNEPVLIKQIDIEEMDNNLIQIVPKN